MNHNYYVAGFKYGNTKTTVDGITFDSKKEANRYQELKKMQEKGEITDLELQKSFTLLPSQKDKDGNVIEKGVTYKADFCYSRDGQLVVEDVKGYKTPEYVLKRKLMLYFHGIRITES